MATLNDRAHGNCHDDIFSRVIGDALHAGLRGKEEPREIFSAVIPPVTLNGTALARAARTASCRMGACTASCASPARRAARAHEARRIRLSGGAARQCSAGPSSRRRSTSSRARPSTAAGLTT